MSVRTPRIVLDTNIVISATLVRGGLEAGIVRHVLAKELQLYASTAILNEYAAVLARPKFQFSRAVGTKILADLRRAAIFVTPSRHLHISPDPDDNMFLECAEAARADFLITGNLRHFPSEWKETRIVSSRQFLALL